VVCVQRVTECRKWLQEGGPGRQSGDSCDAIPKRTRLVGPNTCNLQPVKMFCFSTVFSTKSSVGKIRTLCERGDCCKFQVLEFTMLLCTCSTDIDMDVTAAPTGGPAGLSLMIPAAAYFVVQ
jgi:hypothetical protein